MEYKPNQTSPGARAHHFYIVLISQEEDHDMMVTDRKGKLCHVSKAVADDLGYPVTQLLESEIANKIWDVLLPEPFSQIHHVHSVVRIY
jgi:hypothetical protein